LLQLNIVDTICIEREEVVHYLFTDANGMVTKKAKEFHNLQSIYDEFEKIMNNLQDGKDDDGKKSPKKKVRNIAVGYGYNSSVTSVFNAEEFYSFCFNTNDGGGFNMQREIQMIQCYLPSKGSSVFYKTYSTNFWLEKSGQQQVISAYI
jgi:hypothetical protein